MGIEQYLTTLTGVLRGEELLANGRQFAALPVNRGELERLRRDQLTLYAHLRTIAVLMRITHRWIGQVILTFRFEQLQLVILAGGLQLAVIRFHLTQYLVHRRLRLRRDGQQHGKSCYHIFFHTSCFLWIKRYIIGMIKPFNSVEVSNPPRITTAIGL